MRAASAQPQSRPSGASGILARHAPVPDTPRRIQVLRRSRHGPPAFEPRRHPRPERLRQVQRHRRRALGDGRVGGLAPARRGDERRDLQRFGDAQARRPGQRRTGVRQRRRPPRRRLGELRRDLGAPPRQPRRHQPVLPERHALPAARRDRAVPRHRPRAAQLRDRRAGHDLARHRRPARGTACLPRRGRRHLEVQGTPARDRNPHPPHAREPRPPRRRARGTRAPPAGAGPAGACRRAVPGAARRRARAEDRAAGTALAGAGRGHRRAGGRRRAAGNRAGGRRRRAARRRGRARPQSRRTGGRCRGARRSAGPPLRARHGARAPRTGAGGESRAPCARGR